MARQRERVGWTEPLRVRVERAVRAAFERDASADRRAVGIDHASSASIDPDREPPRTSARLASRRARMRRMRNRLGQLAARAERHGHRRGRSGDRLDAETFTLRSLRPARSPGEALAAPQNEKTLAEAGVSSQDGIELVDHQSSGWG